MALKYSVMRHPSKLGTCDSLSTRLSSLTIALAATRFSSTHFAFLFLSLLSLLSKIVAAAGVVDGVTAAAGGAGVAAAAGDTAIGATRRAAAGAAGDGGTCGGGCRAAVAEGGAVSDGAME